MNTVNKTVNGILGGFIEESIKNGNCIIDNIGLETLTPEESLEAKRIEEEWGRELEEEADYNRFKKSMAIVAVLSFIFLMLFFSCSPSKSEGPIVEVSKEWEAQLERQDKYERKGTYNLERTVEDN